MVGNEGSLLLVSQMFVLAIKGGSTTNRGLAATDTPTDTHKGPHTTPLHPCPYGLDGLALLSVFAPAPPDITPPLSLRLRHPICGRIFHGGSTTKRGLVTTDTHKGPHTTLLHPCPYVYDTRFVVESFTVVKGKKL